MSKQISCVYKIVERCNLNCTYCYFFYGGDESYKKHPPYASLETTQAFADFLKQGCIDLNINEVRIGFHGGEPLMIGPQKLSRMCDIFLETLEGVQVTFTLQTNAVLVNDEWLEVFKKYHIYPGVSLDGPADFNDIFRIDKRNRGTYHRTVEGLKKLANSDLNYTPGILCVINPGVDAKKIYRHFVDDLNITNMDFLLPHTTHEQTLEHPPQAYGQYLCDVFDEWSHDDDPSIEIRILKDALMSLSGASSSVYGRGCQQANEEGISHLLNVSSNGDLGPVSELMTTSSDIMHTGFNVSTHTLSQLYQQPVFAQITEALTTTPDDCQNCCWQHACSGGDLVTRYKHKSFNNRSNLCEGLFNFYAKVARYMLQHGIKEEEMLKHLKIA